MKTKAISLMIVVIALLSCKTKNLSNTQKVNFGIYETLNVDKVPKTLIDSLKTLNIYFEKDTGQPIIGYILTNEPISKLSQISQKNLKLMRTAYTVDKENKYNALVFIKEEPIITNKDIKWGIDNQRI